MSKSNFKKSIQKRYSGRGKSWVKVEKGTEAYNIFMSSLEQIEDANDFIDHITREGFGWLRFSRVEGNETNPFECFELRYRGSKFDHPDTIISMPHSIAKEMPLLGNTPLKMQLEITPSDRKQTSDKTSSQIQKKELSESVTVNLNEEIRIIKETALTKPSNAELESWYNFLRVNDLYEDNV
jgi:hypothetical protein